MTTPASQRDMFSEPRVGDSYVWTNSGTRYFIIEVTVCDVVEQTEDKSHRTTHTRRGFPSIRDGTTDIRLADAPADEAEGLRKRVGELEQELAAEKQAAMDSRYEAAESYIKVTNLSEEATELRTRVKAAEQTAEKWANAIHKLCGYGPFGVQVPTENRIDFIQRKIDTIARLEKRCGELEGFIEKDVKLFATYTRNAAHKECGSYKLAREVLDRIAALTAKAEPDPSEGWEAYVGRGEDYKSGFWFKRKDSLKLEAIMDNRKIVWTGYTLAAMVDLCDAERMHELPPPERLAALRWAGLLPEANPPASSAPGPVVRVWHGKRWSYYAQRGDEWFFWSEVSGPLAWIRSTCAAEKHLFGPELHGPELTDFLARHPLPEPTPAASPEPEVVRGWNAPRIGITYVLLRNGEIWRCEWGEWRKSTRKIEDTEAECREITSPMILDKVRAAFRAKQETIGPKDRFHWRAEHGVLFGPNDDGTGIAFDDPRDAEWIAAAARKPLDAPLGVASPVQSCSHKWTGHLDADSPYGPGNYLEFCALCGINKPCSADLDPPQSPSPPAPLAVEGLTLSALRTANAARCVKWHKGEKASLEFRAVELAEEIGEICGAIKKLYRFKRGMPGGKDMTANLVEELADGVICLDLLAMDLDIDLGAAVAAKFNKTSEKHGFSDRLPVYLAARGEVRG